MEQLRVYRRIGSMVFLQVSVSELRDTLDQVITVFENMGAYFNQAGECYELRIDKVEEAYLRLLTIPGLNASALQSTANIVSKWGKTFEVRSPKVDVSKPLVSRVNSMLHRKRCLVSGGSVDERFKELIIAGGSVPHKRVVFCSKAYEQKWLDMIREIYPEDKVVKFDEYESRPSIKADWVVQTIPSLMKTCDFYRRGLHTKRNLFLVAVVEDPRFLLNNFLTRTGYSRTYEGLDTALALAGYIFMGQDNFKLNQPEQAYCFLRLMKDPKIGTMADGYKHFSAKYGLSRYHLSEEVILRNANDIVKSRVIFNTPVEINRVVVPCQPVRVTDQKILEDPSVSEEEVTRTKLPTALWVAGMYLKVGESVMVSTTSKYVAQSIKDKYKSCCMDLNKKLTKKEAKALLEEYDVKQHNHPRVILVGKNTDLGGYQFENIRAMVVIDISNLTQHERESLILDGKANSRSIYYLQADTQADKLKIENYLRHM